MKVKICRFYHNCKCSYEFRFFENEGFANLIFNLKAVATGSFKQLFSLRAFGGFNIHVFYHFLYRTNTDLQIFENKKLCIGK